MEHYHRLWDQTRHLLPWDCLFVTPHWLQTVVEHLGANGDPQVVVVSHDGNVVGIAPLSYREGCACFLGTSDVCDYQDIVVAPGHEQQVMRHLMDFLGRQGIRRMDLHTLRPDATLSGALIPLEEQSMVEITRLPMGVTYETQLTADWESYLMQLNGKQRHEVRRKIRRLDAHGTYSYRMADCSGDIDGAADQFLRLFHLNRKDKADFMDEKMTTYFRKLIERLAHRQMLRLYFLDIQEQPVATVLCFDYNGTRYLYNCGYDADYHDLSVGILSKIFSIRTGIEAGCSVYDFLKGDEVYKKRVGGRQIPLYRYQVAF